jgi:hypothetical protein
MEEKIIHKSDKEIIYGLDRKGKRRDFFRKLIYFLIGLGITIFLCFKCLPCNNCHTIVTIHLSILSLICFVNAGIPVSSDILSIINKVS